jgi:hypothetical protein
MNGKGSDRRPELKPGAYADGFERIWGKMEVRDTCDECGQPFHADEAPRLGLCMGCYFQLRVSEDA